MGVTIQSSINARERILVFGSGGSGKSRGVLDIARQATDAKFFALDNDDGLSMLLEAQYQDVASSGRFEVVRAYDWTAYIAEIRGWREYGKASKDDWLIVDSMTQTWDDVKNWYSDEVVGDDLADWMLQLKKGSGSAKDYSKALSDSMNYDIINRQYFKLYNEILRWPGHVYMTAEADAIDGEREKDALVKSVFATYGQKPKGQKKLPHIPQTVLYLTRSRVGEHKFTCIKDRHGGEKEVVAWDDFASDYLLGHAGWRPVKINS
jgi:hypothetical protein